MIGTVTAIHDILKADTELLNLLPLNAPYYNRDGTRTRGNSILPNELAERKMVLPVLVIQEGNEVKMGTELESETIYLRCYNDKRKGYVDINNILDRVREVLDRSVLEISDKRFVKIGWETTLPGLVDESVDLKFKEQRYSLLVL